MLLKLVIILSFGQKTLNQTIFPPISKLKCLIPSDYCITRCNNMILINLRTFEDF